MITFDCTLSRPAFTLEAAFECTEGVTALFGTSGSGKSTIIGLIAGLERPTRGHIVIDGAVLADTAAGISVPPHRRRIGLVFQDAQLLPHLSVKRNLLYGQSFTPLAPNAASLSNPSSRRWASPICSNARPTRCRVVSASASL